MNEVTKIVKARERVIRKYERLPRGDKLGRLRLLRKYQALNKRLSVLTGREVKI